MLKNQPVLPPSTVSRYVGNILEYNRKCGWIYFIKAWNPANLVRQSSKYVLGIATACLWKSNRNRARVCVSFMARTREHPGKFSVSRYRTSSKESFVSRSIITCAGWDRLPRPSMESAEYRPKVQDRSLENKSIAVIKQKSLTRVKKSLNQKLDVRSGKILANLVLPDAFGFGDRWRCRCLIEHPAVEGPKPSSGPALPGWETGSTAAPDIICLRK